MYKLCPKNLQGQQDLVLNLKNYQFIPFDVANIQYQEYLKWLEEGNTPEPADE